MIRSGSCALAVALVVSLAAPQSVVADDGKALRARALFEGGSKRYQDGDLKGALELYRDAYKLVPRAKILLNIARLEQKLGLNAQAANSFAAYAARTDADPKALPVVRDLLAKLDAALGKLEISAPRDGAVYVDDRQVGVGPKLTVRVKPGRHQVRVAGGSAVTVSVDAGSTRTATISGPTETAPNKPSVPLSPTATPMDDATPRPLWKRTWMWTGVVAAGLAATGIVFGVQSQSAADEVERLNAESAMHDFSDVKPFIDRAEQRADLANVSFIAAGVVGALTLYLAITDDSGRRPTTSAGVSPLRGGAMATFRRAF